MNKIKRVLTFQGEARLVNGVLIKRDADFGILFERNSHLQLFRQYFNLQATDIDRYEDHEILHVRLASGAVVAMAEAHGAAFAASAVEKFLRSGVSHIVRVGTCGVLDKSIGLWDIVVNTQSFIDESTSFKYATSNRPFVQTVLDELMCPTGVLHHKWGLFPKMLKRLLKRINPNPYSNYLVSSDAALTEKIVRALHQKKENDTGIHQGINYTGSARYRQDMDAIKTIMQDIPLRTIDMETSAIMSSCRFHEIPTAILNIRIDNPIEDSELICETTDIKSVFVGITDHLQYYERVPARVTLCVEAILSVFSEISEPTDYLKVANFNFPAAAST